MINAPAFHSSKLIKKIFASGAIGNIIETYDLILISLLATTLSKTFFPPSTNSYTHIAGILYIYFAGLLMRPIGNIIMGLFADQLGRKKLMITSLTFTGIGSVFIGILPGYSYIGLWATGLFIFLRIFQAFFAGIEYINSATYLIETSNKNNRGFFGSWAAIGISGGYLVASFISLIILFLIDHHIIPNWGWRLAFFFSSIGTAFSVTSLVSSDMCADLRSNSFDDLSINEISTLASLTKE